MPGNRKANKTGRSEGSEHFTMMVRGLMEEPAWRALSTTAQALYPWLRLEWKGPKGNNNGRICLSVRQAAKRLGVTPTTASLAFHDLQAKGFIVMHDFPHLGVSGAAKSGTYELTEIEMPQGAQRGGRRLYRDWRLGKDYPVHKAVAHNPQGRNGRAEPRHENQDDPVSKIVTLSRKPS